MKTTTIKHKSTGNTCEAEIYSSFVYLVNEMRQISRQDFDDFYVVVDLKQKVTERLIAGGNNENEVAKMVEAHFEYASSQYSSVKCICECIRSIY